MQCPKCGSEAPDGAIGCPVCGVVFGRIRPAAVKPPEGSGVPPGGPDAGGGSPPGHRELFIVPPQDAPSRFPHIVVAAVAFLAFGSAGIVLFSIYGGKPAPRHEVARVAPSPRVPTLAGPDTPAAPTEVDAVETHEARPPAPARTAHPAASRPCGAGEDPAVERSVSEGLSALRAGHIEHGVARLEEILPRLAQCWRNRVDPALSEAEIALGDRALERELLTEAAGRYQKAAALAPASAAPRSGLGRIAEKRGDAALARAEYREAARLGAGERTLVRLFELSYAANDLDEAADWARRLAKLTRGARKWTEWVARLSREGRVQESMQDRQDDRFVIKYDGHENIDAAFAVQRDLTDAYVALTREMHIRPAQPVTAILYTREEFFDVTRAPSWSGGGFDGKIRIPVGRVKRAGSPALRHVVFHEFVHALVREKTGGNCPVWLHEGLAEYYEGLATGGTSGGRAAWNPRVLRMLEGSFSGLSTKQAIAAYEVSRAAVAHIAAQKGENGLRHLLDALAGGARIDAALSGLGMSYSM